MFCVSGKLCVFSGKTGQLDLMWVGHGGMVVAIMVTMGVILSCGREVD